MACQVAARMLQTGLSITKNEVSETSYVSLATCAVHSRSNQPCFSGQISRNAIKFAPFSSNRSRGKRHDWIIAFATDTGGITGNGGQQNLNGDDPGRGRTRLGRILSAGGRQLLDKLNSARKNFPTKIFLLLLGFYTANTLATILGQTGDWDVLVAGIVVAAIEGIGMLMYRMPSSSLSTTGRLQSFVVMMNYWKAGVCLSFFVDAFKVGS